MRSLRTPLLLAAVVAAMPPARLVGQAADSVRFHRGQWGTDFTIGYGFVGAGVIRFHGPARALVLGLGGQFATGSSTGAFGEPALHLMAVNLSLGARRYHALAPRLLVYRTFGLAGSYNRNSQSGGTSSVAWTAGVFASAGAGWMVTPHLELGAEWKLSASFGRQTVSGSGLPNAGGYNTWSVMLGMPDLVGQLYF